MPSQQALRIVECISLISRPFVSQMLLALLKLARIFTRPFSVCVYLLSLSQNCSFPGKNTHKPPRACLPVLVCVCEWHSQRRKECFRLITIINYTRLLCSGAHADDVLRSGCPIFDREHFHRVPFARWRRCGYKKSPGPIKPWLDKNRPPKSHRLCFEGGGIFWRVD